MNMIATQCVLAGMLAAGAPSSEWQTFTDRAAGFSVSMPGQPRCSSAVTPTPIGPAKHAICELTADNAYYMVLYTDVPALGEDDQRQLDVARDGFAESAESRIISEQRISLGPYPGRQIEMESDKGFSGTLRLYLVRTKLRIFQVAVVTATRNPLRERRERFLGSFRFIK